MIGKVAHCFFIGGLVLSYFHDGFLRLCPGWFLTPDILVIWTAIAITLCAMVFYTVDGVQSSGKGL